MEAIGFGITVCWILAILATLALASFWDTYGWLAETIREYSIKQLVGKKSISQYHDNWRYMDDCDIASVSLDEVPFDGPMMAMSFATFRTLFEAAPDKIQICLNWQSDELPGAILYDRAGNGEIDMRICMATRKDARQCIKWFREKRRAEKYAEVCKANERELSEKLQCTEAMKQDIKRQFESDHTDIMRRIDDNRRWRADAERRQEQLVVSAAMSATKD